MNNLSEKTLKLIETHSEMVDKKLEEWIKLEMKLQGDLPKEVMNYFNEVRKRYYPNVREVSLTPPRLKLIRGRIRDDKNNGLPQFKGVIDHMFEKWFDTDMEQYLTPETLFSTKFQKYLDIARSEAAKKLREQKRYA